MRSLSGRRRSWLSRAGEGRAPTVRRCWFPSDQSGAVLAETIIVVPVMVFFMMGILEFGAFLWTKLQVENGLKDAARFMGRCSSPPSPSLSCEQAAKKLAVYGYVVPPPGSGRRSGNWSEDKVTITSFSRPNGLSGELAESIDGWTVSTSFDYPGSIFLDAIGVGAITLSARHEERYVGR